MHKVERNGVSKVLNLFAESGVTRTEPFIIAGGS
jgi:hypothetical protein